MSIRVLKYKQPLYEAFDFDDEDSVDSLVQSSIKSAKKNSYIGAFKKKVESDLDEYDDYIDMTLPENLIDDVLPEINLYLKGLIDEVNVPEIRIIVGKSNPTSLVYIKPYEIDLENINAKSQLTDLCNMVEILYEKHYDHKLELFTLFPLINFKFRDFISFKPIAKSLGFLSLFSYWFYLNGTKEVIDSAFSKFPSSYAGYKTDLDGDYTLLKMIYTKLTEEEIEDYKKEFTEGYDKAYSLLSEEAKRYF